MTRKNPTHPGLIVLHDCMEPLGLSLAAAAKKLGVKKAELEGVIKCRVGVNVDLAVRLAKEFGSTPTLWLTMQKKYDLANDLRQVEQLKAQTLKPKNKLATAKIASRAA